MKRNLKNMNKEAFCRDLSEIDWDFASSERPSNSLEKLLSNVEKQLNKYAPYKKITQREVKIETMPWITRGIRNSLACKVKIYKHMMTP